MFGIPAEVFWPTAAFGSIVALVFGGLVLLRLLPQPRARVGDPPDRQVPEDLAARLDQLDQLQERISELEERVDFAERLMTTQRESERLGPPQDQPPT